MNPTSDLYRQIVESSVDGIWIVDVSARTVYANPRTGELLGYSVAELAGLSVYDVLDEVGQGQLRHHLQEMLHATETVHREVPCLYIRKDGSPAPLRISETILRDDDGTITGFVHRLSDDTEGRALLAALSRRTEQLDEAQAIAGIASWEMDLASGELHWSHAMFDLLGFDREDTTPTPDLFFSCIVEEDRERVESLIRAAHEQALPLEFETRMRSCDGRFLWVRGLGRAAYDEAGEPMTLSGTVQDVTAIKQVELELLDAATLNALMQVMATAANEATTLTEALIVARNHILAHGDWSRAVAFEVVPGTPKRLRPMLLDASDPSVVPTSFEAAVAEQALAAGHAVFEETTHPQTPSIGVPVCPDGEAVAVVVITCIDPFQRHAMLRAMAEQIGGQLAQVAQRERVSVALAAARDAAMESSRLKSDFLATMSHEIRTPMNGVIGLNELLLRTQLDPRQRQLAEGVHTAGTTLLGLLNDILDLSKIEAGQLEIEHVPFRLAEVVDQSLLLVSHADRDRLEIVGEISDDVPEVLVGDPTRLRQVLANLLSNAVKFTPHGTVSLRVATTPSERDGSSDGLVLRVEVEDTGVGISEDQVDRLFEPFRQADASTTRRFGGTGLGLAICRQLVHAMGGTLEVASRVGRGSTFSFTAAVGVGHPSDLLGLPEPHVPTGETVEGRILLVEDNELNQMVAAGLIESLGLSVDIADNGLVAVALCEETEYAAVLMDLQMPQMDGYSAARAIRASERASGSDRRVPIIAMTASALVGERERCLAAGMDEFLTKPVSAGQLAQLLVTYTGLGPTTPVPPPLARRTSADDTDVDLDRLAELMTFGENAVDLVRRSVENFERRGREALSALAEAARAENTEVVGFVAHKLRGSALNLGAVRVGAIAHRIEMRPAAAVELLPELEDALGSALRLLREVQPLSA